MDDRPLIAVAVTDGEVVKVDVTVTDPLIVIEIVAVGVTVPVFDSDTLLDTDSEAEIDCDGIVVADVDCEGDIDSLTLPL